MWAHSAHSLQIKQNAHRAALGGIWLAGQGSYHLPPRDAGEAKNGILYPGFCPPHSGVILRNWRVQHKAKQMVYGLRAWDDKPLRLLGLGKRRLWGDVIAAYDYLTGRWQSWILLDKKIWENKAVEMPSLGRHTYAHLIQCWPQAYLTSRLDWRPHEACFKHHFGNFMIS